jgi:hypothetical protein
MALIEPHSNGAALLTLATSTRRRLGDATRPFKTKQAMFDAFDALSVPRPPLLSRKRVA